MAVPDELEGEVRADLLGARARHVGVLFLEQARDGRDAVFAAVGHAASGARAECGRVPRSYR